MPQQGSHFVPYFAAAVQPKSNINDAAHMPRRRPIYYRDPSVGFRSRADLAANKICAGAVSDAGIVLGCR